MSSVSLLVPILHSGGTGWDEVLILVVAILAVPAISWFTGRLGKRQTSQQSSTRNRRGSEPAIQSDDAEPESEQS